MGAGDMFMRPVTDQVFLGTQKKRLSAASFRL